MKYPDFIASLSNKTGISRKHIRLVLEAVPEALLELQVGDKVQTPLGTFVVRHRKKREILLPDGIGVGEVPEQVSVQLRTGYKLKVSPGDLKWDQLFGESSS